LFDIDSLLSLIVIGFCSGTGSALANYFVLEHVVKRIDKNKKPAEESS